MPFLLSFSGKTWVLMRWYHCAISCDKHILKFFVFLEDVKKSIFLSFFDAAGALQ
jgi:hypothetical protein